MSFKYGQEFVPWTSNRRTLETVMGILTTSPWQRLAGAQCAEWSRRPVSDVPGSSTIIKPLLQLHSFRSRCSCLQIKVLLMCYATIKCHCFAFPDLSNGSHTWAPRSAAPTFLVPFHAEMKQELSRLVCTFVITSYQPDCRPFSRLSSNLSSRIHTGPVPHLEISHGCHIYHTRPLSGLIRRCV